jgi:hypothetical protein
VDDELPEEGPQGEIGPHCGAAVEPEFRHSPSVPPDAFGRGPDLVLQAAGELTQRSVVELA